jgi:hypothetical protein
MPSEALEPLSDLDLQPANDEGALTLSLESSVFAAAAPTELQALVDTPCRTLEVEYKSWRNLTNSEDRAELAAMSFLVSIRTLCCRRTPNRS